MKTKPTSLRFEENDLNLAISKSGIKKTQKLMDFLLSEYVRELKPQYQSLPKDYVEIKAPIKAVDKSGKVVVNDITKPPAKTNYIIDTTKNQVQSELEKQLEEIMKSKTKK